MHSHSNTLDFILSNIGQNKVVVPIISNEYEETKPYMEEKPRFDEIENIIDIFKGSMRMPKSTSNNQSQTQSHNSPHNPPQNTHPSQNSPQNPSQKPPQKLVLGFNSLIYCVLESIDPTLSLISENSKLAKVEQFKHQLDSKINLGAKKIYGYDKNLYRECLKDEKVEILNWLSYFLKKTIVLKRNVPAEVIKLYGTGEECIVIEEAVDHYLLTTEKDETSQWKEAMRKTFSLKYTPEKLNTVLVKDLRNIAEELEIPLFKTEEGKKKYYLKNDLKDMIIKSLQ